MKARMLFLLLIIPAFLMAQKQSEIVFPGYPQMAEITSTDTMLTKVAGTDYLYKLELIGKRTETVKFIGNPYSNAGWPTLDWWAKPHDSGTVTDSLSLTGFGLSQWGYKMKGDSSDVFTYFDFDSASYNLNRGYREPINLDGWTANYALDWYYHAAATDTLEIYMQFRR